MTESSPQHESNRGADGVASMPPAGEPPPWIDVEIQQQMAWRDGDVVVSVPVKSGTTWTMNIVHQLRSGGDPDMEDVYLDVPWIELVPAPGRTRESLVAKLDAMPSHRRRAFKTHSAPGLLPYFGPGSGKDVQYVVVVRNPDEVVASFHPFVASHSDAWFDLWGINKSEMVPPDLATFYEQFAKPLIGPGVFGFVAAWWPLRHQANVLLMHFSDMKRDHEGSVRRVGEFLGFEPQAREWQTILECTSFPWMKRHEDKFELASIADVPILNPGAMVRKGRSGAAHEDGVTPEIGADIAALGREFLEDEAALEWAYRGGVLP